MKSPQNVPATIPLTPREKRKKAFKICFLIVLISAGLGTLVFSGILSSLLPVSEAQTGNQTRQPTALIAETGVKIFTSIDPDNGYEDWQLNICSLSTQRFCSLVKAGFGKQVWDSTLASNAGIVNLSTRAISRVFSNPEDADIQQFWRVRYELVSAQGEQAYSAVVSVVQEDGKWKFNGFSLLPEPTPEPVLRGFQEE